MNEGVYHPTTPELARQRKDLAPGVHEAFETFGRAAFSDGALPVKTKQLIAVAAALRPATRETKRWYKV
jgi:alkylhydroperoxidase/carboxymuconolactone decarboxylase family protein YurZ